MGDTHHTATNYGKTSGAWSGGVNYTLMLRAEGQALPLAAPSLIAPANHAHTTDLTPTFTWSSVLYAQAYRLMIYDLDRSFEFKKVVSTTSFSPDTPLAPQRYYWRVRTQNMSEIWGNWSRRNVLFVD